MRIHGTDNFIKKVLYFYISTFRSTCTVPSKIVFCSFLMWCFPVILFKYFLNDLEMVQVALIITGITFVFTLQYAVFLVQCLCILNFSDYYYYYYYYYYY
jgi:hypothetical protein